MEQNYTPPVILDLFVIFGECKRIILRTCRRFNEKYPNLPAMNESKFRRLHSNFYQHGNFKTQVRRNKFVTSDEDNEINVLAYFVGNPHSSIRSASIDLGLTRCSIQRILSKHKFHDYSPHRVHALHPADPAQRIEFCENILMKTQEDPEFLRKIKWTVEAKFSRDGVVNRKNVHYWNDENPNFIMERNFQNKFSYNVFCLLMDNRCSYFVYEENLNSAKYLEILNGTVTDFLDDLPLNLYRSCWYQMDGAPAHNSMAVYQKLTELFEDRWFGRYGPQRWPPRSPDMAVPDFYLWGRIKNKIYTTTIATNQELLIRIRDAFAEIDPDEIRRAVTQGVQSRILDCLHQNGGHIEHLY